jgi:hemerythrin
MTPDLEHKKTHDSFVETISQTKRKIDLESEDRIIEVLVNLILALYEKFSVNTLNLMRELKYRKEQYCIRPKRS